MLVVETLSFDLVLSVRFTFRLSTSFTSRYHRNVCRITNEGIFVGSALRGSRQ